MSRKLGLGLVVTNDCHYLRQSDSVAHDVLLCIGTQRARSDRGPAQVRLGPVLPEVGGRARGALSRRRPGAREHRGDRRTLQRGDPIGDVPPARPSRCRRGSRSTPSSSDRRDGGARGALRGDGAPGHDRLPVLDGPLSRASQVRDRGHQANGIPGLLHDRLGLHPLRARERHPGRARAAARPPVRWFPSPCASPTSIR